MPKPKGSEEKPELIDTESNKPVARARKTRPTVPPRALKTVREEDIIETTHIVDDKDGVEEMDELGEEDMLDVKGAGAKDDTDYEEMTVEAAPDDQKASEPEKPVINRIQPFNPSQKLRDDAAEAHDLTLLKKGKIDRSTYRMNRLDRTVAKEQSADKGTQEAGTSLQLEAMDAWKAYDSAKEQFEQIDVVYAAEYRKAMDRLNDPKKNYDEPTKEFLLNGILSHDGLRAKHHAALRAYAEAEKTYAARYAAWEAELNKKQELKKQYEQEFDQLVADLSGTRAEAAPFTAQEEAWFKQGEEDERRIAEARAEIQGPESLVETPAEIEANVAQAAAMLKSGDLNPAMFDLDAYGSLLKEKARLDSAIEMGSSATARRLQAELKTVQQELHGYEEQVQGVFNERHDGNQALTAREKADIAPKPWRKQELPQGSGTTIKKKGFFSRLFGR